jgi:hypothetical protein
MILLDFTGSPPLFFGILSGHNFNDAQVRTSWRHFVKSEIGLTQEAIVLFLRSFSTSLSGEHNVV